MIWGKRYSFIIFNVFANPVLAILCSCLSIPNGVVGASLPRVFKAK